MAPRNVAFVGAICVTIGWLLASTLTPPVARVQSRPPERATERETASVPQFTEQLQLRLHEPRETPVNRRNPFSFVGREQPTAPTTREPAVSSTAVQDARPLPTHPPLVLSGIGISADARTAVLAHGDTVHVVRVSEVVSGYTVSEITESSVTLTRGDAQLVLRLRH